jgi:hypothetical protein
MESIIHILKFIFNSSYRNLHTTYSKDCSCGKYKKCVREVKIKKGGWYGYDRLYVDNRDHFRCGKVQKQIEQMKKHLSN